MNGDQAGMLDHELKKPAKVCEFAGCVNQATYYGGYKGAGDWAGYSCAAHLEKFAFAWWENVVSGMGMGVPDHDNSDPLCLICNKSTSDQHDHRPLITWPIENGCIARGNTGLVYFWDTDTETLNIYYLPVSD